MTKLSLESSELSRVRTVTPRWWYCSPQRNTDSACCRDICIFSTACNDDRLHCSCATVRNLYQDNVARISLRPNSPCHPSPYPRRMLPLLSRLPRSGATSCKPQIMLRFVANRRLACAPMIAFTPLGSVRLIRLEDARNVNRRLKRIDKS